MVAELGAIRLREKEVLPNELLLGRESPFFSSSSALRGWSVKIGIERPDSLVDVPLIYATVSAREIEHGKESWLTWTIDLFTFSGIRCVITTVPKEIRMIVHRKMPLASSTFLAGLAPMPPTCTTLLRVGWAKSMSGSEYMSV
uniref:Uncharacterized protein n=1 Tax=Pristionchus pacificus TaxID=54126 RepID=A0A2A6CVH6_PRIPA|eukprot:PDM82100.1 hypothetical protein PRIPAC_36493 [Pristionchus pacificus]